MDDSQDQTGAKVPEALKDSATARRIVSRYARAPGVIDTRHTQDHYSRLTEWPAQRHGLLGQLMDRYDLSGYESAGGNMVYATPQGQQHDADESFEDTRPATSAIESSETPKQSVPAASAPQGKFRVSRKPNSKAGKSLQPDAPDVSSQTTATDGRDHASHPQQTEMSEMARPTIESLASSSGMVTDSTPQAQPTVLRLSRKRAGKLVQKTPGPGMDERGSATIADPATAVHQQAPAKEAETPQFIANMPVVSQGGHDKTSESPATAEATVRRATSGTVSEASPVLPSKQSPLKQSVLDQQSSTKENAPPLLRKSVTEGPTPTPQTSDSENSSRVSFVDDRVRTSPKEMGDESVKDKSVGDERASDESVAGEAARRPVATEMKSVASERQTSETLPLVKAQPVSAQVQLKLADDAKRADGAKRADDATENVGPVSRTGAGANHAASQSSTVVDSSTALETKALAVEMRPVASRAQASGIVWRKSVGDASHRDGTGPSGRSVYSSGSTTFSASLPLASVQVQAQAPALVQRQTGGESNRSETGSFSVVQRVEQGAGQAQAQAAPEVDVERITEHVSRAIFRQLAIERERRGF
ncbi:MAG TPA: hypothetical protein VGO91_12535 [Pyrinomonadaceae bacterium]|nr:hypothetical protein [Pyrinomonadaceae bacterium]